ncbi:hypothetical protein chiPu_0019830 [Chiloscyllium punctatum]|uniref:Uncharacterized protein n=1 Tax=Chiloscyllium punctatum TaxID=137246 RepID=A0A401RTC4_CHIPU|nr:hypothetical protein [Chiloscyllium punctatum]
MGITERLECQLAGTESHWLPEQLEELQSIGKQLQQSHSPPQHPDQEWAGHQVTQPDTKRQGTQSQWLDHQACGDQQLQHSQLQQVEEPGYNASDDWSSPQAGWPRVQKRHCLHGQWLNHQPHCSQQDSQADQGQLLDTLMHYPDQERQCQQGEWLHCQCHHLGQYSSSPKDQPPDLKPHHCSQVQHQTQQWTTVNGLQDGKAQSQEETQEQQVGIQQQGCSQGRKSEPASDRDEEGRLLEGGPQQADGQMHQAGPQVSELGQEQYAQRLSQHRCTAGSCPVTPKPASQSPDRHSRQPGTKAQPQTKPSQRAHVCRRSRHHQPRGSQPKGPKEHLLQLSVKLGEHSPVTSQSKQRVAGEKELCLSQSKPHRKKRATHHSANENTSLPDNIFGRDIKLHKEQRTEVILTSQDTSKEMAAKKKQLAQLLQMVVNHTSHLLKGHVTQSN